MVVVVVVVLLEGGRRGRAFRDFWSINWNVLVKNLGEGGRKDTAAPGEMKASKGTRYADMNGEQYSGNYLMVDFDSVL